MITVLIADDSSFMRAMVKQTIQPYYSVVAEAKDGSDAIEQYRKYRPALVLLDLTMPKVDGLAALREIMKIDPAAKVIVFSAWATKFTLKDAVLYGAKDFVIKPNFQQLLPIMKKLSADFPCHSNV